LSAILSLLIEKVLDFTERDYLEEEIRVEVVKGPVKVPLYEGLVELSRGTEYGIPRWLAEMLSKEGVVQIRDDQVSVDKLSSIAYNEESLVRKLQLVKLPGFFYMLVNSVEQKLQGELKAKTDMSLFEEYRRIEDLYLTIGRLRVRKLLNFLLLTTIPQEILEKLSEEEKVLFSLLREILFTWMRKLGLIKA